MGTGLAHLVSAGNGPSPCCLTYFLHFICFAVNKTIIVLLGRGLSPSELGTTVTRTRSSKVKRELIRELSPIPVSAPCPPKDKSLSQINPDYFSSALAFGLSAEQYFDITQTTSP